MKLNFEPFYQEYLNRLFAYGLVLSTAYNDQNTAAPKGGALLANEAMAVLQGEAFKISNNPETIKQIKEYEQKLTDGSLEKQEVSMRLDEIRDTESIPAEFFVQTNKDRLDAGTWWHKAKQQSDYSMFRPWLEKTVNNTLKSMTYSPRYKQGKEYDFMLDQFEKGMDQEQYDAFFEVIKRDLPPLIEKVKAAKQIDDSRLSRPVSIDKQEAFNEYVLDVLKRNPEEVYMTTTEHPYTCFMSSSDVRINTHYYEDRFLSAVLSTVHEYGHALFGLQIDPDFLKSSLYSAVGSAAHESQSRLLENHIGRRRSFWKYLYPKLTEMVPEMADIPLDDLVDMINVSVPSLVRTEADELTYPLHILIRYEIEKMMASGEIDYDQLPKIWADKYEEYLGVRPENDKEGVLQDMHWSDG
ncbi:MAG: carboxypeptidase M32, partial [Erysipelotrichaceae bacterium]|nr:carboxypeptidase M32 [Erysipelotrichaceae bacterium]